MTEERAMALNAVGAVNYSGISTPGDSIFDDIFDWVSNIIPSTINAIGDNIVKIINAIGENTALVFWVATTGINSIITNLGSVANQIIAGVFVGINSIITNLGSVANQIVSNVFIGINSILTNLASVGNQIIAGVYQLVSGIGTTIVSTFSSLSAQVRENFVWITNWLTVSIPKILGTWWDFFLAKVFDFAGWIPDLFDAVSTWMSRDIPGHSPWWQTIFENIWNWFNNNVIGFFKYMATDPGEKVIYGLNTSFAFIGDFFSGVIDGMMNALISFTENIGPMTPGMALTQVASIGKVAMASLTALAAMTLTGEVVGFWKHIGLGNISAIFYDMSNYKLITAGMVGALVGACIRTPLSLYFNNKFRQNIPNIRELSDMYTDESLTRAEFGTYLGYHGIADGWHDKYADIAFRAMSPFQLKTAAQDGSFDEGIFSRELTHAGFRPETKKMLLDSFRKAAASNVQTYSVAGATGRFKSGWTDENQFTSELRLLRVNVDMIPVYLAMTKLDYATAYLNDLETAYVNAVRSGQIGIDDYRQALLGLGMVPQRVEGKVFIEQARIKPSAALGPVAGAKSVYLTDAGKLIIDTTRRRRRKDAITRDQELAAFSDIGMPVDLAAAYADNDDVRLKEPTTTQAG